MKSVTIVADDRVGLLADISYLLGKAKVNIESISVDVVAKKAVISLTIKDPDRAKSVLENAGFKVTESNSIVIKLVDKPGELSRITSMLAESGINIENVHIVSRDGSNTILSVVVDKPKKAVKLLDEFLLNKEQN